MSLQSTATSAVCAALGFDSLAELQTEFKAEWVTLHSGAQALLVAEPTAHPGGAAWVWSLAAVVQNGSLDLAAWAA